MQKISMGEGLDRGKGENPEKRMRWGNGGKLELEVAHRGPDGTVKILVQAEKRQKRRRREYAEIQVKFRWDQDAAIQLQKNTHIDSNG